MSYKFYQFGVFVGADSSGENIPSSANYGVPQVESGTLGAATITITFNSLTKWVLIRNTHDSSSLRYSFDGGTNWSILGPYGESHAPVSIASLQLQRVLGNPTYYVEAVLS